MPDSTEAPQVRKTLPTGPDRPRAVSPGVVSANKLIPDPGISSTLFTSTGVRNYLTVIMVDMGMSGLG